MLNRRMATLLTAGILCTSLALAQRGGAGRQGTCDGSPDMEAAAVFTGTVSTITVESGLRQPSLVLADGSAFSVGPTRAWLAADFDLAAGEEVSILAFPCSADPDRWIAVSVEKVVTREKLVLRDDEGRPMRGKGRNRKSNCDRRPVTGS